MGRTVRRCGDGRRELGRIAVQLAWVLVCLLSTPVCADGQTVRAAGVQDPEAASGQTAGGHVHGTIKSGGTALPGVAVTATNTLTGKRYATTTDITGAWSMTIPQSGRYVLRTEFAAFAPSTHEALLNAASRDQLVNFDLLLASRAARQNAQLDAQAGVVAGATPDAGQVAQAMRQLSTAGSLTLMNALSGGTDAAEGGTSASGVATPGAAASNTFGTDSVAVSGQAGSVSPLAGMDPDRMRDALETMRAQGGGGFFGGDAGGGPGGGFGGGGPGGGGGRVNFRNFRADQPHGAVFWTGGNSALNALPFKLPSADSLQSDAQPQYGSNRFGVTFIGAPFIPKLMKPSGKDTIFLTLSGQRSSSPFDQYALVPDAAERSGCPSAATTPGCKLLAFFPLPNLPDTTNGGEPYNYYYASTAQSNSTQAGLRYMRGIGANATMPTGRGGGGGGRRSQQNQGLRQSVNANANWSHSASDNLNIFPRLGGKQFSDSYSLQTGYSLGYRRMNNNLQAGWNRTRSQATNFFTGTAENVADEIGIKGPGESVLNSDPLNYGVPNVVLGGFSAGLSEQQPSFRIQQTLSLTEALSWIKAKHNFRFGGDFRRVHQDVLGGSNATGTFYFTGVETKGTAIDDLIAGLPQESSIQAATAKTYLRQNVWDMFAQDDWRVLPSLSLSYGLRYEYFSPYSEKYNHLGALEACGGFTNVYAVSPGSPAGVCGSLPSTLVYPFRAGIAPRVGVAVRLPKSTVIRAGYGINFNNGQFASFASIMAHEPPFANVQTNEATAAKPIKLDAPFPVAEDQQPPNYALDPHYSLPYVQVWNIDVQKTLPWGILLNAGYNGSKGTHLDITSAPRPVTQTNSYGLPDVLFNYEQSEAFSNFNNGTLRLRKRLQKGVSMGAYYQYSHSIDNAGSVGGTSTVVAQNWQDLLAEEGNSSFDQRHRLTGDYLFELPFGKDKAFVNGGGTASKILEGWSVSGTFTFATGTPLTPTYAAAEADVARGTAGSLRPTRLPGVSVTAGASSLEKWFNKGAFQVPTEGAFGNASRNSIPGPGTISNGMSLSKTAQFGDTRSLEMRATASNVFNTVQYAGVDTNLSSPTAGQVTSAAAMRQFTFLARFRF